jgi:hypothetical protein
MAIRCCRYRLSQPRKLIFLLSMGPRLRGDDAVGGLAFQRLLQHV